MKSFLSRFPLSWACYLAYFIGVSLQSGGIVHYSINPDRYGRLIAIGAVIFVIGAVSSDLISKESLLRESGPTGFITFILSSLVLSIGVGMIGGSVQHFTDVPERAPIFVGLGIVLSALGYHGRFRPHHTKKEFITAMLLVSSLAISSVIALRSYAAKLPVAAEHGHGADASQTEPGRAVDGHEGDRAVEPATTTFTPKQTASSIAPELVPEATEVDKSEVSPPTAEVTTSTPEHDPSTHAH